ncbi:MAG: hypothetical protein A2X56_12040 [Nitrospirae bacterium GWC2_57_13]|jgi:predicted phosphodiesterase|nr:MAG: hypothetical protein A2X56_12040 [Nitrospirae bacterium GWC2_57_13]
MRYAIISDIHSNLEALTAVLARIAELKVDAVLCLGDIVGYNASPNECIDIVRREGIACILGNHDTRAAGLKVPTDFNAAAMRAIQWTREQLTEESRQFLRGLPAEQTMYGFFIFHGKIHDTDHYILSKEDVKEGFALLAKIKGSPTPGFFGHTHLRTAYSLSGKAFAIEGAKELHLEKKKRYLINPGSVGQPRDRDPRAAFLVYDREKEVVFFHRTEYDIQACQEKIIRAGLPSRLAERLVAGW